MEDATTIWTYTNGSAKAGAPLLDATRLSPFEDGYAPPSRPADRTLSFAINQSGIITWMVGEAPFREPNVPIIYGDVSDGWGSNTTMHLPINSTIDIIIRISDRSMDTVRSFSVLPAP